MSRVSVDVNIDQSSLQQMLRAPNGAVGVFMRKMAMRTVVLSKGIAPVKTGALRNSIVANPIGGGSWQVIATVNYSLLVHEGMGPQSGGRLLKFPSKRSGARRISAKSGGGRKANPFLWDALREAVTEMT